MLEEVGTTGIITTALWIGSIALVLMVATVVWGFARMVEYTKRMAVGTEDVNRQLGRIRDCLEDLRSDLQARKV